MTPGEAWREHGRVVAATAGTCLLVVLVGWAALIGPSDVFAGPGPARSSPTTTSPITTPPLPESDLTRQELEKEYGDNTASTAAKVLGAAIQLLALAGAGFLLYLLGRRALRAWRNRRRFDRPPDVDFETIEDGHPERVRRAMTEDATEQLRVLSEGQPRNAIVACWHRFELQAAAAGLPRHQWETSSELALRMFDRADVDSGAVSRLMGLYREARFSEHELGEAERAAAIAALTEIQAQVRSRQVRR